MTSDLEEVDFEQVLQQAAEKHRAWASTPEGQAEIAKRDAEEQALAAEESRRAAEAPFATLSNCGVPRRVVDILHGYQSTHATSRVLRWVEDRAKDASKWCLVLSADKGVGKSVAAGLWLMRSSPVPVRYFDRHEDKSAAMPAWWPISRFARVEGFDGKFDALCSHPGPLVIDDLGSEYLDTKGWFLQALDAFIDARYAEYRPTLITTNLAGTEFKKRYSERVVDRIREGGSFYEFQGASMRKAAA